VPIFRNKKTPWPWEDCDAKGSGVRVEENRIYGDSMAFGPNRCGLKVTLETNNIEKARMLHDQLIPAGPVMTALTAATPFFRVFDRYRYTMEPICLRCG
jgi:glutamate--cysteine ligase catalytic subunit